MITSKNNEIIKQCIQIKQKKYSRQLGLCLIETQKLVNELLKKGLITIVLCVERKLEELKNFKDVKVEIISEQIAKYISDSSTPDGVLGICKIPDIDAIDYKKCLILDRIQDPANLGAIIRSACAFGYNTIISIDSVYPYSYKAIRSSMGNIFNINYIESNIDKTTELKKSNDINIFVADMYGENIDTIQLDKNKNKAIVIGNEGQGVSDDLRRLADKTVSIPMSENVESLNASVSAGIIMYLLK